MSKEISKYQSPSKNPNHYDIVNAAFIIIGDEILSGRTPDQNLNFLATELSEMGISLKEVRVVPDIQSEIIFAVNELRKKFNYVFTSGGIGPTHDDITSLAVALAFDDQLVKNKEASEILTNHSCYSGENINEARMKMAYIPSKSRLIDNQINFAPGFIIENVIVMAGVPKIMREMFLAVKKELIAGKKIQSKELKISLFEVLIAADLEKLQNKFPSVVMGSYPFDGGTSLVFRSSNLDDLEKSFSEMESIIKNKMSEDLEDQKECQEFIRESVKDGSYFQDALDWYIFRYVNPVCERTVLFIITVITGIACYILVLIIKNALPMVQEVPVIVKAKDSSLYFPVIKKLRDSPDLRSTDEAVAKYLLVQYLQEREEYDFRYASIEDINSKFNVIKNNSSAEQYRNFQDLMSKDNANSPIANFGQNVTREITINSITFPRVEDGNIMGKAKSFMSSDLPNEAEIRYDATLSENGVPTTQKFLTKISFKFAGVELKNKKANTAQKKLDFMVIGYKTYTIK